MAKMKDFYNKHREIILYLIFGVCTTFVGWAVYFASLWTWKGIFSIPVDDTSSAMYLLGYSVSQVLQWVLAVLFAFFTNKKWVFTDADETVPSIVQLAKFACGRAVTFFVDYFVTYFAAAGLAFALPKLTAVLLFGKNWNFAEIGAKVLAAALVIAINYIVSKLVVFKSKPVVRGKQTK